MNDTQVAVAETARVLQPEMADLGTGLLVVVVGLMGLALAWMLTSAWKGGAGAHGDDSAGSDPSDFWAEIGQELDRSRRFSRDFSLVRIGAGHRSTDVEVVDSTLRSIDRAWPVDGTILVMLPECGREQADALVERIRAHPMLDLWDASFTVASFPADGITSGALLAALDRGATVVADRRAAGEPVPADVVARPTDERRREQPQREPVG